MKVRLSYCIMYLLPSSLCASVWVYSSDLTPPSLLFSFQLYVTYQQHYPLNFQFQLHFSVLERPVGSSFIVCRSVIRFSILSFILLPYKA